MAIAVAHAHRDDAYALSRWTIEELKRRVPIWKREHYVDGTREWVDPTGRPVAEVHRERAPRSVRPHDRVSAHLGHGSLQLPLPLLHAAGRTALAAQVGHPQLRGDSRSRDAVGAHGTAAHSHHGRRADDSSAARDARALHSRRARRGGHRALDEWREASRAGAGARGRRTRPREHFRRQPAGRPHRRHRAARPRLRARGRRDRGAGGGPRSDQAERRRHARRERRRSRGLRAAHARPSVARALHRAHAGRIARADDRRDGGAERRGALAHSGCARRAHALSRVRRAATARRRTTSSRARREASASSRR